MGAEEARSAWTLISGAIAPSERPGGPCSRPAHSRAGETRRHEVRFSPSPSWPHPPQLAYVAALWRASAPDRRLADASGQARKTVSMASTLRVSVAPGRAGSSDVEVGYLAPRLSASELPSTPRLIVRRSPCGPIIRCHRPDNERPICPHPPSLGRRPGCQPKFCTTKCTAAESRYW